MSSAMNRMRADGLLSDRCDNLRLALNKNKHQGGHPTSPIRVPVHPQIEARQDHEDAPSEAAHPFPMLDSFVVKALTGK